MPSHPLEALYNAAPVILWVEDLLTSQYLDALWQHERRIKMYVGGGHETLKAVVDEAFRSGRHHVLALRDRDFGPTNRTRWSTVDRVFVLETFEIECFLLDPPALSACALNTSGLDEASIRRHLQQLASTHLWWMACRKVIAQLREDRQTNFPAHPKPREVSSHHDAERVVLDNEWVRQTAPNLARRVDARRLRAELQDAHDHYEALLSRGSWTAAFSGKELWNDLVTRVFTRGRPSGSAAARDLAKAVARQQVAAKREPPELVELRDALLARVPLP